jgi:hypothetical protein
MDLRTARAVKYELSEIFATRASPRRFALGVAVHARQFVVAVRAPSAEHLREEDLEMIRGRSADEVSVRYTGPIAPLTASQAVAGSPRVGLGASVAHHRSTAGTLGFFARRNDDGAVGFVSNNHVLALGDRGAAGDAILHPAPHDGGAHPRDVIGHLDGSYPRLAQSTAPVDCAFARIAPGVDYDPWLLDPGEKLSNGTMNVEEVANVGKVGRTTGITLGSISAFDLDGVMVDYPFGTVRFSGQIEVQSANGKPFARGGDSGSLVFSRPGNHPVGMVFAASAIGGAGNVGLSYVHPIDTITAVLGVTFV